MDIHRSRVGPISNHYAGDRGVVRPRKLRVCLGVFNFLGYGQAPVYSHTYVALRRDGFLAMSGIHHLLAVLSLRQS